MAARNLRVSARYAVLWVVVVALSSAMAWYAIGRSGRELAALDTAPAAPITAATSPTSTGSGATTSGPGAPPTGPDTGRGALRTLTTTGGRVTVVCEGAVLSFRAATPADGWSVQGPALEDNALELKFVASDGREVEVYGRCRGGQPQVTSTSD